jgi:hypothetical protein
LDEAHQSHNADAESICGLRKGGMPFQEPWEMDYACPICTEMITEHTQVFDEDGNVKPEYQRLHFSQYQGFMYCEYCNLDMPSYFCKHHSDRALIIQDITHYLELIQQYQALVIPKESQSYADRIRELEIENVKLKQQFESASISLHVYKMEVDFHNSREIAADLTAFMQNTFQ